jgi:2-polyprenyl-6-methoxyphenol hydroxylase-like FAD-dependent oxidoreductase
LRGDEQSNGFEGCKSRPLADEQNPHIARAWLLDQFAGWDQSLLALIQEANDSFVTRPLYMLPVGHRRDFRPGVTLLGDAAHLMSPFAGEGVNLAMLDAADLANAINTCSTLEDAVRTYEATMFPRAESAARHAYESINQTIAPDAPAHTLAHFKEWFDRLDKSE